MNKQLELALVHLIVRLIDESNYKDPVITTQKEAELRRFAVILEPLFPYIEEAVENNQNSHAAIVNSLLKDTKAIKKKMYAMSGYNRQYCSCPLHRLCGQHCPCQKKMNKKPEAIIENE